MIQPPSRAGARTPAHFFMKKHTRPEPNYDGLAAAVLNRAVADLRLPRHRDGAAAWLQSEDAGLLIAGCGLDVDAVCERFQKLFHPA